jgi:hypothetical protein
VFVLYGEDAGHSENLLPKNWIPTGKDPFQLCFDSEHSSLGERKNSVDHEFDKLSEGKSDEADILLSSRINGRKAQFKKTPVY